MRSGKRERGGKREEKRRERRKRRFEEQICTTFDIAMRSPEPTIKSVHCDGGRRGSGVGDERGRRTPPRHLPARQSAPGRRAGSLWREAFMARTCGRRQARSGRSGQHTSRSAPRCSASGSVGSEQAQQEGGASSNGSNSNECAAEPELASEVRSPAHLFALRRFLV
jgi:hypothetical protein